MVDPSHNPQNGFEREDLSPRSVLIFLIGLGVATIVFVILVYGVFGIMDRALRAQRAAPNPLATDVSADTRHVPPDVRMKFPEPRLEVSERAELKDVRLAEEDQLNSYGWVDQKTGVVRIPITRAMELVAQRGLPVRSQAGPANLAKTQPATQAPAKPAGK
jgi:hypothetical protein